MSTRAVLDFPYDPDANAALKRRASARWSPEIKSWWCSLHRVKDAYNALVDAGYNVVVLRDPKVVEVEVEVAGDGDPIEALLNELDRDLSRRVYRQLSAALHPDAGGSNDLMQRLNRARERTQSKATA